MASWYAIRAQADRAEVAIYDEIGACGISAKGFLAELGALPEGAPIDLRLNSPGGSVFDAVAIFNALKRHSGPVTVWIDGIAASAASYLAMAGDEIVMPGNAFLMIHDPAGMVIGTAGEMRAMAEALDKVKSSLVAGYAAKSGRAAEEIAALMAVETWLDASDALAQGFADRLADPVRIAARFDIGRFRNAPPDLVGTLEAGPDPADAREVADASAGEDPEGVARQPAASGAGDDTTAATAPDPEPDPAPDPAPAMACPTGGTPPDPASIRAAAIGHAQAVVELCRLAGLPQMACRFLERDAPLDEVRAALLAVRAEATPDISPHHPQPGPGSGARPWGDVIARTFKLKG